MTELSEPERSPVQPANTRIPMAICAAVAELLSGTHPSLEDLFYRAGAIGPPPDLAHHSKWKVWLFESGRNPAVDGLAVLGQLIEEFMDLPPLPTEAAAVTIFGPPPDPVAQWRLRRDRLV